MNAYLAPEKYEDQVARELKGCPVQQHGRLFIVEKSTECEVFWAQNVWRNYGILKIESIRDAAQKLKTRHGLWHCYDPILHRRCQLIKEQLPFFNPRPFVFGSALPASTLGSWTLLDETTLLCAVNCQSPFPNGEIQFVEEKVGPPSRAYLKLWEALTLLQRFPKPGERCLDLGASPGSWSWVIGKTGAEVIAIDRSPLAESLHGFSNVHFQKGDAFAATPDKIGKIDWLFCDVVCYPDKLFKLIKEWIDSGLCSRFVVTLKFQGDQHYGAIPLFASIPGSNLRHLFHNKHELTWTFIN